MWHLGRPGTAKKTLGPYSMTILQHRRPSGAIKNPLSSSGAAAVYPHAKESVCDRMKLCKRLGCCTVHEMFSAA